MTVDNRYYETLGEAWWDPTGPMGLLLRMNRLRYGYFRTVLTHPRGAKLLDIGCGGGFLASPFAADEADVYGVDLSPNAVLTARKHAAGQGFRLRVVSGRAEALPFASGALDAVLLADVLEHLDDYRQALAEASRVLRPGGLLLYETVNRTLLSLVGAVWIMERLFRKIPPRSHDWKMFIRPSELEASLEACGFRSGEVRGIALKDGIFGFLLRAAAGKDPWEFEVGEDTRVSYLGHATKSL